MFIGVGYLKKALKKAANTEKKGGGGGVNRLIRIVSYYYGVDIHEQNLTRFLVMFNDVQLLQL